MNVTLNNKPVWRVTGILVLPFMAFWLWLVCYGLQWFAISLMNWLFQTHVKMTLLNWAIVTVIFFVLRLYRFTHSKS